MSAAEVTRFKPVTANAGDDPREIGWVKFGDVIIDQNVQRDVSPAKLEKMAADGGYNYDVSETISLVERADGTLVAVEGQHRVMLGQTEHPDAYTWMTILGSEADEPGIALRITKSRTKHSAYQEWALALAKGEPLQVAADEVLTRLGLTLSNYKRGTPGDNKIAAVVAVRQVMEMEPTVDEGAALLDTTLSTMAFAFGEQDDQWASNLIKATGRLIHENTAINTTRLASTLSKMTPRRWLAETAHKREGQTAVECIGTAVVTEYNRGLHSQTRIAW